MYTVVLVVTLMSVAYLFADYRRWLEIESIHDAYEEHMVEIAFVNWDAGYEYGKQEERKMNPYVPYSTDSRV